MIENSRAKVFVALRNANRHQSRGGNKIEESLAHTTWDCTYHIVWIPKYRRKALYGECRIGRERTFWARGYYVSTIGLNEDVIKKYIQNQEESDRIGADN